MNVQTKELCYFDIVFLERFCKEQEDCVCLKNPSRITPLQSSPLQCKLRSAVHFFKVFSDDFSRNIMIYPLRSSSICLQVQKFKMQVHSFSANPSRASGLDPNPIVINPKPKDSCSRFLVRYGSASKLLYQRVQIQDPHPIR